MDRIDVDAVIRIADEATIDGDRASRVTEITDWVRKAGVFVSADNPASLDREEEKAMNLLMVFMEIVRKDWKMTANGSEFTSAIHVLQGFVVQHMLHRLNPEEWADWLVDE